MCSLSNFSVSVFIIQNSTYRFSLKSCTNMYWDKIIIFLILKSVMGNHDIGRIIHGKNAAHGQFPYQVCF